MGRNSLFLVCLRWREWSPHEQGDDVIKLASGPSGPIRRLHVNLAARGYAMARLLQTAMVLILLASIGYGSWCWMEASRLTEDTARRVASVMRAQAMNRGFAAKLAQDGLTRSQAEIDEVYRRVDFANQLAQKRSFSWTLLLNHLEAAIPGRTSIQSVRLDFKESAVNLKGRVIALADLNGLVDGLERHESFDKVRIMSHRFQEVEEDARSPRSKRGVRATAKSAKPRKHRVVEFELNVGYARKLSGL